jgi:cation transport ATPase
MLNGLTWGLILFIITVLAGFWLLITGKPYRSGIVNIHKLVALGASGLYLYTLFTLSHSDAASVPAYMLFSLGGFLVVLLFGSGAMLSIGKPDHKAVLIGHRIGSGLWHCLLSSTSFTCN